MKNRLRRLAGALRRPIKTALALTGYAMWVRLVPGTVAHLVGAVVLFVILYELYPERRKAAVRVLEILSRLRPQVKH